MCYYTASKLSGEEIFQLEHDFVTKWEEEDRPEYYVASGFGHPKLPILTAGKRFKNYNWGLIPHWVKDWEGAKKSRQQCLNCISEEAPTKSSFRDAIKGRQFCMVPINGFYEWHDMKGVKYPHYIYPKDGSYFLVAGLFNSWTNKDTNEVHDTFTMMTTQANERMEWIHNIKKRMPVILNTENAKVWLDENIPYEKKIELFEPYDSSLMADHPISKLITSRKEKPNQPDVMKPFEYPELASG